MKGLLYLAVRYMLFHRWRTIVLILGLTLTLFLPTSIHFLVDNFERSLWARSDRTPMVVGAKGSRFDLVLHALYFRAKTPELISMAAMQDIAASGFGSAFPIYATFRARGFPIVGTSLEYFEFRDLTVGRGRNLVHLGECVLGAQVASKLDLSVGDTLMSDPENVFNIAGEYPLKMHIVGILDPSDSVDDQAVFVDIKTSWIIAGIGHGHADLAASENQDAVLRREGKKIVANAAVMQHMEVTEANRNSFHFHAEPSERPLSAVLVAPKSLKASTLLRGRYQGDESRLQVLRPREVVAEMIATVSRVKQFLDLNFLIVGSIVGLFLILVILLSLRLRELEMETLYLLGCRRGTVWALVATELALVAMTSLIATCVLYALTYSIFESWLTRMFS